MLSGLTSVATAVSPGLFIKRTCFHQAKCNSLDPFQATSSKDCWRAMKRGMRQKERSERGGTAIDGERRPARVRPLLRHL